MLVLFAVLTHRSAVLTAMTPLGQAAFGRFEFAYYFGHAAWWLHRVRAFKGTL
jgi:hypothetical protein